MPNQWQKLPNQRKLIEFCQITFCFNNGWEVVVYKELGCVILISNEKNIFRK